jgi:putative transposase
MFVDDHGEICGVEPICRVLPITPSTYRAHVARRADPAKVSARLRRDLVHSARIQRVHEANFGVYGVRKAWRQLGREGTRAIRWACSAGKWRRSQLAILSSAGSGTT